jgi:uncharacterized membrane protein YphA (DoxX/SURF4 family)
MQETGTKYLRWVLGLVLLIAGLLKVVSPENMIEVLIFFGIPSEIYAYVITYLVSLFEIILGVLLITKKVIKVTNRIALATYMLFLGISIIGYLDNWQFACGCLGRFSFGKFDLSMVLRNFTLTGMAGWVMYENYIKKKLLIGVYKQQ